MTVERNKELLQGLVERVFNTGMVQLLDDWADESLARRLRLAVEALHFALPDFELEIVQLIGEGDWLAARWRASGTFLSPLCGYRPTGQRIAWAGNCLLRLGDGRLAELHAETDFHEALRRSGAERRAP
jgi:predicted ester cyclase